MRPTVVESVSRCVLMVKLHRLAAILEVVS
jgi:hypothetical protein